MLLFVAAKTCVMFLEIVVLLLTALGFWNYLNTRRQKRMIDEAGIKGPVELPVLGNAPVLMMGESAKSKQLTKYRRFLIYRGGADI